MELSQQEDKLLLLAQAGDQIALRLLMDREWTKIHDWICGKIPVALRGVIDPDDIFATTFFRLSQKLKSFIPDGPDHLRRFVMTIALCRLRDMKRAYWHDHRRVVALDAREPQTYDEAISSLIFDVLARRRTPSGLAARREAITILGAALEALPGMEREILRLHYFEKLSSREIGRRLDLSQNTVLRMEEAAFEQLRLKLGHWSKYLSSTT